MHNLWNKFVDKLKSHFTAAEFRSIAQTFFATAAVEAIVQWNTVLNGDLSKDALIALAVALLKSLLKSVWMVETTLPIVIATPVNQPIPVIPTPVVVANPPIPSEPVILTHVGTVKTTEPPVIPPTA